MSEETKLPEATPSFQDWMTTPYKGWLDQPEQAKAFYSTLSPFHVSCQGLRPVQDDKPVVLTKIYKDLLKTDPPKGPQGIGDCTSWGNGNNVNISQAVQIATGKATFKFEEVATESIYGFARCEIGKQWNSYQDGAVGAWVAEALTKYGCLSRIKVGAYDPKRAKAWGAKGVPDELEAEAKLHLFGTSVLVTDFDQAAALIQSGHPVSVCSNQGFSMTRDQDGTCAPKGKWYHCMVFVGVRFGTRPGLLCLQSWGAMTPDGPLVLEQPDNSFWVDKNVSGSMLAQRDSYSYDGFAGFARNDAVLDTSF